MMRCISSVVPRCQKTSIVDSGGLSTYATSPHEKHFLEEKAMTLISKSLKYRSPVIA